MNVTKHIVSEMNENQEQHCILCGEKIFDLKDTSSVGGTHNGFTPGEIYIWGENPKNISSTPPRFVTINHCKANTTATFPRRNRLDLNTVAEKAIYDAIQEVEKVGADPKLTDIVVMLGKAKELLSDFVDDKAESKKCKNYIQ